MGGLSPRAVLLDALGTLLALEPPGPALRERLAQRCGLEVDQATADAALKAEIAYYRRHNMEGGDAAGLAGLRMRCAEVFREALGPPAAGLDLENVLAALMDSLRFTAFPDATPALERLRAAGLRLVVVSNWDVSLHQRLEETGLAELIDGAVASAEAGAAKPDRAIFARGLELAGVAPDEALHVGDSPVEDVEGARAAGIEAVLVLRGSREPPAGVRWVRSLAGVGDLVA